MAKEKGNKALYIGIGVVAVVAVVVGIIIAVTRGGDSSDNGGDGGSSSVYTASDFSPVSETIKLGDYDAMFTLAKAIQNGEAIGKIVEIDGYVSHPGSKYSIVERNADGSESIGTEFVIESDNPNYPKDGDHVIMVAKVVERSALYWNYATIQELVSVVND